MLINRYQIVDIYLDILDKLEIIFGYCFTAMNGHYFLFGSLHGGKRGPHV